MTAREGVRRVSTGVEIGRSRDPFFTAELTRCKKLILGSVLQLVLSDPSQKLVSYKLIVGIRSGAPNGNFRENICSEDNLRSRIFGAFVVKLLACLPLLGFSNIDKMV